jgi:hypothetical protein
MSAVTSKPQLKLSVLLVLILACIGGVLEYANQNWFGVTNHWHPAITYGVLMITTLVGTIPVGRQLGVDFEALFKITPEGVLALTTLAYFAAAGVQTFDWSSAAKGIVLAFCAFVTAIFGTSPNTVLAVKS